MCANAGRCRQRRQVIILERGDDFGGTWRDFVETMAADAGRLIDDARRRGARTVAVSQAAFDRWSQQMQRQGKAIHRPPLTGYEFHYRPARHTQRSSRHD